MTEQLTIGQITAVLIEQMIHLTKVIPSWLGLDPAVDFFTPELRQFKAIDAQVWMLLCTEPLNSRAATDWHLNFVIFLRQTLRQSRYCLQKYIVLIEQTSPTCSANLVHFWQDLSPLLSQATHMINSSPAIPGGNF